MSDFQEKSGTIDAYTSRYRWTQTIEDVQITFSLPVGTRGKDVNVAVKNEEIAVRIHNEAVLQGKLFSRVKSEECLWTIEDNELCLVLVKAKQHESWKSVIAGQDEVDPFTSQEMDKKMMLEKFQREHPGFDFSGAEFSGQVPADPVNFGRFD